MLGLNDYSTVYSLTFSLLLLGTLVLCFPRKRRPKYLTEKELAKEKKRLEKKKRKAAMAKKKKQKAKK